MLAIQKFEHVDWLKTYQLVPTLQKVEIACRKLKLNYMFIYMNE